jgi:hypothetical protein
MTPSEQTTLTWKKIMELPGVYSPLPLQSYANCYIVVIRDPNGRKNKALLITGRDSSNRFFIEGADQSWKPCRFSKSDKKLPFYAA